MAKSEQVNLDVGGSNCEVFELSTGSGRSKLKCLFCLVEGEVLASPKVIGMSDKEAHLCMMYDRIGFVLNKKHLLAPISWMIKEKPQFSDDLRKLSEMARSEIGKFNAGTSE